VVKVLFALFALGAAAGYGLLLYLDWRGRKAKTQPSPSGEGEEGAERVRDLAARLSALEALCRDLEMTRDDTRAALGVLREMVNRYASRMSEIERAVRELEAARAGEAPPPDGGIPGEGTREERILSFLKGIPLFEVLSPEELSHVAGMMEQVRFPPGKDIIRRGEKGRHLYVLTEGRVQVLESDVAGNKVEIARLGKGEWFGEMSLLADVPCTATVRSVDHVSVLRLSAADLQRLMTAYPGVHTRFFNVLSRRLRDTAAKVRRELEEGVVGDLREVPLEDVVDTVCRTGKTGKIFLSSGERTGVVSFAGGTVVGAETDSARGEDAFYLMMEWEEGTFRFRHARGDSIEGNMHADPVELLMEGTRRRDEARELLRLLGGENAVFFPASSPGPGAQADPAMEKVRVLVDGRRTLEGILRESGMSRWETLKALERLQAEGTISGG